MNAPEVTNYRRTTTRKIVTVSGATDSDVAVETAMNHTNERYSSLFAIFTAELGDGCFLVTLCTD